MMIEILCYDVVSKQFVKNQEKIDIKKYRNPIFYDTDEFNIYHQRYADKVFMIVIKYETKYIAYYYIGIKDNEMRAPYSSPFSMIYLNNKYKIRDVCFITNSLIECAKLLNYNKIIFTFPPSIYSDNLINSFFSSFSSNKFKVKTIDINNFFDLSKFCSKDIYLKSLIHAARQNYNIAQKNNLIFTEIPVKNYKIAYDVIKINREQMGYPLKISEEQMMDLISMENLTCRCFGVKKENDIFIATAIIFDITDEISQVVYWGDNADYRNLRPMALLTTEIFTFYNSLGKKNLDIGPSSEEGIINIGLADFKKSIGCDSNIKITFEYEVKEKDES